MNEEERRGTEQKIDRRGGEGRREGMIDQRRDGLGRGRGMVGRWNGKERRGEKSRRGGETRV